jgi:hypothetical protein
MRRHLEILENIVKQDYCCLVRFNVVSDYSGELKSLIEQKLPVACRAFALIIDPQYRKTENVAFLKSFADKGVLVRVFTTEREARTWLRRNYKAGLQSREKK